MYTQRQESILKHLSDVKVARVDQMAEIFGVDVYKRQMLFLARLGDALDDFHVVDVESADGVAAVVCLLEHFGRSYQCHDTSLLFYDTE